MTTAPKQVDTGSVEGQVLDVVRELLLELGSERAAANLSMDSLLDRDLGLGSLERVELLVRLEARFKTRLPEEVAQEAETPSDWARAIFDGARPVAGHQRYRIIQPAREASEAPASAKSWPEVLRHFAQIEPDRVQIHLLEEESGRDITYGRLLETASRVAAGLIDAGLRPNETVAIMLPTCADFFYAFFGVMLAGGIAVPIYPPARADKIEEYVRRQVLILKNAEVRFLISFDRVRAVSQIMRLSIPSLIEVTSVDALSRSGAKLPSRGLNPAEIAFIQYTSGSTGDPKGVVLTHSNVLANVRGIGWSVNFQPDDYVVSWLPLYHDMGLIGSWLFSVYHGAPITLMSPLAFLSRPERWMWAMHDSRGSLCPAPNFSYELCARKIPDAALEGLDLSRWRVAINAGEAVLPDTLARFEERFKPYGFRAESFVPCYGLAESSVALSFTPMNRRPVIDTIRRDLFESAGKAVPPLPGDSNVLRFVANGRPMPDHEIKLLDDEGNEVGDRLQGRIFFRGPSRTTGYYRNPKASSAVITADGWMDSGDLGYWAGGELYVTGRLKDCIIKSGRNIIPQEIEAAAADVPGVRKGCVAAFGALDPATGTERLVIVAETRAAGPEELHRIEEGIVQAVDAVLGIPPDKIVLVAPQNIPKTSSGKIRRNATRTLYLEDRLSARRRPPWMQIARLWLENTGNGLKHWRDGSTAWLHRSFRATCFSTIAYGAGVAVRLIPGRNAGPRVAKLAARTILQIGGHSVQSQGNASSLDGRPTVLIGNRAGHLDPLVAMAHIPSRFLFADPAPLHDLPAAAEFLLKYFSLGRRVEITKPENKSLDARLERCLANGFSILVFPDGPVGAPPERSRFRLNSLRAAAAVSAPVCPILFRGTEGISWHDRHSDSRARNSEIGMGHHGSNGQREDLQPQILAGEPLQPTANSLHDMIQLRERIRQSLSALDSAKSVKII
ncbi:MAG TPA: AMP-binding protein [Terriglobia bacterium]|nr:AMP-binding protein [Terriglobia bacterium]